MTSLVSWSTLSRRRRAWLLAGGALVGLLAILPTVAGADTSGGQSSSYSGQRSSSRSNPCLIAVPWFSHEAEGGSSTLVIRNDDDITATLNIRALGFDSSSPITRSFDVPADAVRSFTGADLGLARGFEGSLTARSGGEATATPTATRAATSTPVPTATPGEGTAVPTPTRTPTRTPTTVPAAGCAAISGVTFHDSTTGDRVALEPGVPASDLFLTTVHKRDMGFDSVVVVQNTNENADATVRIISHSAQMAAAPQTAEAEFTAAQGGIDMSLTVRRNSATKLDLSSAPDGMFSLEVDGPSGSSLVTTVYHMGPNGMAAAINGFPKGTARSAFLPLIFNTAGNQNAYVSVVNVQNVGDGAFTPRITFTDRDTGERVGPFFSPVVLREGDTIVWWANMVPGLQPGHIYSAEAETDTSSGIVAAAGHLNLIRNTVAAYSGFADGESTLVLPAVYRNCGGLVSGIQIQNTGGSDRGATIRFKSLAGGTVATVTVTVPANSSRTVYLPTVDGVPDGFCGSAEITGQDLAVVANIVRYPN